MSLTATRLEPLLSFDETREVLRVSKATLHRLVARGEITSVKVADRRLFERQAIEAFIAAAQRRRSVAAFASVDGDVSQGIAGELGHLRGALTRVAELIEDGAVGEAYAFALAALEDSSSAS